MERTSGSPLPTWDLPQGCEIHLIDSEQKALEAIPTFEERFSAEAVCGFDAEWQPAHKKGQEKPTASLVQVAVLSKNKMDVFLIDLLFLSLETASGLMCDLLSRADILKVGHSVKGDIKSIARALEPATSSSDSGRNQPRKMLARSVFDLATWPAFRGLGLAQIAQAHLHCQLDKTEQLSGWGTRPLSPAQIEYAAKDAAVCVAIFQDLCTAHGVPSCLSAAQQVRDLLSLPVATAKPRSEFRRSANKSDAGDALPGSRLAGPIPWATSTEPSEMRFACDETLEGLARTLRLCGVDTNSPKLGKPPHLSLEQWLLQQIEGGRLALTADRRLFRRLMGYPAYLVGSQGKQAQLQEVTRSLGVEIDAADLLLR
mmetsp:Transcript_38589/g.91470  ORF Transcript_38589/g.91470 Transcript_38589/m.91470 type:complete len:371 (-) Transcript_38589:7-1119(-)